MRLMKFLFVMMFTFIMLSQVEVLASATDAYPEDPPNTLSLSPDPDSDLVLGNVLLETYEEFVFITIEDINVTSGVLAYDIYVNLDEGTYLTQFVSKEELEVISNELQKTVTFASMNAKMTESALELPFTVLSGEQYAAEIWVETRDPVNLLLARTKDYLRWSVGLNDVVAYLSYADTCIGYTTSLNTHWYVTNCPNTLPTYPASDRVRNITNGSYINWDFGLPGQSTTATHYIEVVGYSDGSCYYTWSAGASGEGAYLLNHSRVVQSCN